MHLDAVHLGLSQRTGVISTRNGTAGVDHLHRVVGQLHLRIISERAVHRYLSCGPDRPPVCCRHHVKLDLDLLNRCACIRKRTQRRFASSGDILVHIGVPEVSRVSDLHAFDAVFQVC